MTISTAGLGNAIAKSRTIQSHYSLQDFFTLNSEQGVILDWNGMRNVLTSEDFIIGLQEGLEEEVGEASASVMYSIGCEWGRQDSEFFAQWFEKDFNRSIRQTNLPFLLETWWWPFAAQGWGRWNMDMSDRKQGFMFISIYDSAVARTLGDVGKPVCHLYAGLFSGFFTNLVNKKLDCIEIQCYSMGENFCKFLLGGGDRIDAASFWLNEGATSRDIERRLRDGGLTR
ncbi:putative hydrocarbon binding protein (contains V4R domain) [Synechococcus sp. PCC 7502]|uniref:V4R domain-containing protein n=1 Tax=Synechococcus sp. PCC 7502 TaxID=1173263 RepID=UPI00029FAB45|nr:V4R domain-containing protein [Synechococcus sp. PCC 7502]AFY74635.1 putative hydrocarbon binding protein (contains V4R domain) [Synechococcus sp. PCC 7502]